MLDKDLFIWICSRFKSISLERRSATCSRNSPSRDTTCGCFTLFYILSRFLLLIFLSKKKIFTCLFLPIWPWRYNIEIKEVVFLKNRTSRRRESKALSLLRKISWRSSIKTCITPSIRPQAPSRPQGTISRSLVAGARRPRPIILRRLL